MDEQQYSQLLTALNRIATALEAAPHPAPNWVKDLNEYPNFDWGKIKAEVISRDKHGAIAVRYCGRIYTRRNPLNKYGVAIWYSRSTGGKGEEDQSYERLITFKEVRVEADPLNEKTLIALRNLKQAL